MDKEPESTTSGEQSAGTRVDQPTTCAHCGESIALKEWHPVAARVDDQGAFQLYAFCSEACRSAWAEDG